MINMSALNAEELEIGKKYMRGNILVVLKERTGETETYNEKTSNVYIFDEVRDFYQTADHHNISTNLQVWRNVRRVQNPDWKIFTRFEPEEFHANRIKPIEDRLESINNFLENSK
jgi:hypothetical protein